MICTLHRAGWLRLASVPGCRLFPNNHADLVNFQLNTPGQARRVADAARRTSGSVRPCKETHTTPHYMLFESKTKLLWREPNSNNSERCSSLLFGFRAVNRKGGGKGGNPTSNIDPLSAVVRGYEVHFPEDDKTVCDRVRHACIQCLSSLDCLQRPMYLAILSLAFFNDLACNSPVKGKRINKRRFVLLQGPCEFSLCSIPTNEQRPPGYMAGDTQWLLCRLLSQASKAYRCLQ